MVPESGLRLTADPDCAAVGLGAGTDAAAGSTARARSASRSGPTRDSAVVPAGAAGGAPCFLATNAKNSLISESHKTSPRSGAGVGKMVSCAATDAGPQIATRHDRTRCATTTVAGFLLMASEMGTLNVFDEALVLGDTDVATDRAVLGMREVPTVGFGAASAATALVRADVLSGSVSSGKGRGIRELIARPRAAASGVSSHARGQTR